MKKTYHLGTQMNIISSKRESRHNILSHIDFLVAQTKGYSHSIDITDRRINKGEFKAPKEEYLTLENTSQITYSYWHLQNQAFNGLITTTYQNMWESRETL